MAATGTATLKVGIEWDEQTRKLLDALSAAVVVGPKDRLVLVFDSLTLAQLADIRAALVERAPDLEPRVLIVGGPLELAVLRGEPDSEGTG